MAYHQKENLIMGGAKNMRNAGIEHRVSPDGAQLRVEGTEECLEPLDQLRYFAFLLGWKCVFDAISILIMGWVVRDAFLGGEVGLISWGIGRLGISATELTVSLLN